MHRNAPNRPIVSFLVITDVKFTHLLGSFIAADYYKMILKEYLNQQLKITKKGQTKFCNLKLKAKSSVFYK